MKGSFGMRRLPGIGGEIRDRQGPRGGDENAGARETLRTFGPFLLPHWPVIALAVALVLAGTGTKLLRPWPLGYLFGTLFGPDFNPARPVDNIELLIIGVAGAILGIAVLDSLVGFLRQFVLYSTGQKVAYRMRVALYAQLQRLSLGFHNQQQTGDLITRVTKDVDKVQGFITDNIVDSSSNALTLVGMLAVMFWLDWQLSLAMLLLVPILFFSVSRFRHRIRRAEQRVRSTEGDITSMTQETMSAIKLVKAFGRERYETHRFEAHMGEQLRANLSVARVEAAFGSFMDVLVALALAGLVWFGSRRVLSGSLGVQDLFIFVSYIREFYGPTRSLSKLLGSASKTAVRAQKIAEVLNEEPAVRDLPDAVPAPPLRGHIRFEHVGFSYLPGRPVLSDIDFEVRPGEVLALVGSTGAGKSTISGLIPRLYDPTEGRVLVDGEDIRRFELDTLQPQISMVLQNSVLFRATVWENIAYGRPDASLEEIVEAARLANAHEFIAELPEGYDTVLGERGDTLSGGQRQRIVIARALVRNAPILILDEPTTGLDARSEQLVLEALDRLMRGRTTIVIAHKLSTVHRADSILVLEHGRIVERGRHEELLALGGRYAELYGLQSPAGRAPDASARVPAAATFVAAASAPAAPAVPPADGAVPSAIVPLAPYRVARIPAPQARGSRRVDGRKAVALGLATALLAGGFALWAALGGADRGQDAAVPGALPTGQPAASATAGVRPATPPVAPRPRSAMRYVSTEGALPANLRARPGADAEVLARVPHGASVRVLGGTVRGADGTTWHRVRHGSRTGFVRASLLSERRTAAPAGADAPAARPGVIGTSRVAWERAHGRPAAKPVRGYLSYENGKYLVVFSQDDKLLRIERGWGGGGRAVPVDVARAEARKLLPSDARLMMRYVWRIDRLLEVYDSPSVGRLFGGPGADPGRWMGSELNTTTVVYRMDDGEVSSLIVDVGSDPHFEEPGAPAPSAQGGRDRPRNAGE